MSLRKLTTAFDETIRVGGIGAALFFVMIELTYINSKSLHYLDNNRYAVSWLFATIGALAYSIVTITVMRHKGHLALKRIFPVFDMILVFCGYNFDLVLQIENGTINLVRVALSIFIAVFTGLITYSLGMLNYEQSSSVLRDEQIDELKSELVKKQTDFENLKSEFSKMQTDFLLTKTEFDKKHSDFVNLHSQFVETESELHKYKSEFIKSELSRIRKKKKNRTEEETKFLEKYGEAA